MDGYDLNTFTNEVTTEEVEIEKMKDSCHAESALQGKEISHAFMSMSLISEQRLQLRYDIPL